MCKCQITERTWNKLATVVVILMAAGLSIFIYGLQALPKDLPEELKPAPTYPPDANAYSRAFTAYQIQSEAFKFVVGGLAICVTTFLCVIMSTCCVVVNIQPAHIFPLGATAPRR